MKPDKPAAMPVTRRHGRQHARHVDGRAGLEETALHLREEHGHGDRLAASEVFARARGGAEALPKLLVKA